MNDDLFQLGERIVELAARINIATYEMLTLIAEFDRREGWAEDGSTSCAEWLAVTTGRMFGTARENVRVAHALEDLPLTSAEMKTGKLSYTKVRTMTRVATPETEEDLLKYAHAGSAAKLEQIVRGWKHLSRDGELTAEEARHQSRAFSVVIDGDGMYVMRGRLEPEVGAVLMRAIEAASDALYRDESPDARPRSRQRRADAAGLVAEQALAAGFGGESGTRAERFQVAVHTEMATLEKDGEPGRSEVDGVRVSAESSRRMACDAAVVPMTHRDGEVMGVGRKTRTIPPHIRRALEERDRVFRVGVLEGESWEMLGTVRQAAFDARGNLYLYDGSGGVTGPWLDPRVLVFDADGSFVHTFGRSGQGPGEFNVPLNMAVMRDGTTVVGDLGHRAYQLFDESGAFVRLVRMGMSGLDAALSEMHTDPGGNGVYSVPPLGGALARPGTDPPTSRPIIRLDLEGDNVRLDTVAHGWLPPPPEVPDTRIPGVEVVGRPVTLRDIGFGRSAVFEPQILIGVLPGGRVVYSDSSAYALKVMEAGSAQVGRVIARPFNPEPVTPAIEEAEKERMQALQAAMGGSGRTKMLEIRGPDGSSQSATFEAPEPTFFPELPVIHALSGTWDGRIWVQRRGEDPNSGGAIDVLTAEGDYLGTFPAGTTALPDAFGPDGLAAFIELDEFDVATVVVRRLPVAVR